MRLVVASMIGLLLAACESTPEQKVNDFCTVACECSTASPTQRDQCINACVGVIPSVTDECLDCVYLHSQTCGELVARCEAICDPPQPQP
jgi:hypothetical protein